MTSKQIQSDLLNYIDQLEPYALIGLNSYLKSHDFNYNIRNLRYKIEATKDPEMLQFYNETIAILDKENSLAYGARGGIRSDVKTSEIQDFISKEYGFYSFSITTKVTEYFTYRYLVYISLRNIIGFAARTFFTENAGAKSKDFEFAVHLNPKNILIEFKNLSIEEEIFELNYKNNFSFYTLKRHFENMGGDVFLKLRDSHTLFNLHFR